MKDNVLSRDFFVKESDIYYMYTTFKLIYKL